MSGYAHQTVDHNASIEAYRDDEYVRIDVYVGEFGSVTLPVDAETAWHFAWDIIASATGASPELIGALTERLHELGGAS